MSNPYQIAPADNPYEQSYTDPYTQPYNYTPSSQPPPPPPPQSYQQPQQYNGYQPPVYPDQLQYQNAPPQPVYNQPGYDHNASNSIPHTQISQYPIMQTNEYPGSTFHESGSVIVADVPADSEQQERPEEPCDCLTVIVYFFSIFIPLGFIFFCCLKESRPQTAEKCALISGIIFIILVTIGSA